MGFSLFVGSALVERMSWILGSDPETTAWLVGD
jgi:hypothetical protein